MSELGFLDKIKRSGLLSDKQLAAIAPLAGDSDPQALARVLVQKEWLTPFQVKQIAAGNGDQLRLGGYILLDRLGEGAMGEVCRASHLEHGTVALKILKRAKLSNPGTVKRFIQEVALVAKLNHPNLVRAVDWGKVDGWPYLAMEYIDGQDLSRLVKQNGPLPIVQACQYARQAALALQYAHEMGIIHRDMKPGNLIIGPDGNARLLDLGLARAEEGAGGTNLTQLGQMIGTPDYLAPEQAIDPRRADARSDIYGLGCTLFYLVAGKPPFTATSLADLLLKHQEEEARPLRSFRPDAPDWLVQLLGWMMNKRPEDRPATAKEVANKIEEFLPDVRPPLPPPVPLLPPLPPPPDPWANIGAASNKKRKGGFWLRAAMLFLLVSGAALGATYALWPAKKPAPEPKPVMKKPEAKPPEKEKVPEVVEPKPPVKPKPPAKPKQPVKIKGVEKATHFEFRGHKEGIGGLAVSPDGNLAATAGQDNRIVVWDLAKREELCRMNARERVRQLAFAGNDRLRRRTNDVRSWALPTGKGRGKVEQGDVLLAPRPALALPVKTEMSRTSIPFEDEVIVLRNVGGQDAVAFHPTADRVLAIDDKGVMQYLELPATHITLNTASEVPCAIWGQVGKEILFGTKEGSVQLLKEPNQKAERIWQPFAGPVSALALSAEGLLLAGSAKGEAKVFDLSKPNQPARQIGTPMGNGITAVGFALGGKWALTADGEGTLRLWDLSKLE